MNDPTFLTESCNSRRIAADIKNRARNFAESVTNLAEIATNSSIFGGSTEQARTDRGPPLLPAPTGRHLSLRKVEELRAAQGAGKRNGPAATLTHKLKRLVLKLRKRQCR